MKKHIIGGVTVLALVVYVISYAVLRATGTLTLLAGYSGTGPQSYLQDSLFVGGTSSTPATILELIYAPLSYSEALARGSTWRRVNSSFRPDYDVDAKVPFCREIIDLPYDGGYHMGGVAAGIGFEPGAFFLLSKKVFAAGNRQIFTRMLTNACPSVRLMGIVCLAQDVAANAQIIRSRSNDIATVMVFPFGCRGDRMQIADFAQAIISNEEFRACFVADETNAWSRPQKRNN